MTSVLLATDCKFWLRNRGGFQRIDALCRFLSKQPGRFDVFFTDAIDAADSDTLARNHNFASFSSAAVTKGPQGGRGVARRLLDAACALVGRAKSGRADEQSESRPDKTLGDFYSERCAERFRALCGELQPECIIIERAHLTYLLKEARKASKCMPLTLVDTIDVLHERAARFREMGERHWISIEEAEEKAALDEYDVIMAIQDRDEHQFRRMLPSKRIIEVGHASEIVRHTLAARRQVTMAYVATGGAANRRALEAFLADIWPGVRARTQQSVTLVVVGDVCRHFARLHGKNGLELRGRVPELSAVYAEADVVINPVIFGGGLKIKNVEALCNCRPLVTTTVGAEGMSEGVERAFLVCDEPERMISKLCELIGNPDYRSQLSDMACEFATSRFTEQRAYSALGRLLREHETGR